MALKGKPIAIGTTDTTIYTCPATTEASVHGLVFANTTGSAVTITLKMYVQVDGVTTTFATGLSIAANSTFVWPKPIDMNAGDYITASASAGSAVVAMYSVYQGSSSTPTAVGFTPRGTWSSAATYAANDIVAYNGKSYLAIQASTNQTPNTATAYWMVVLDYDTSIVVTLTGTQTLTNKTLVAPALGQPASGDLTNCTADGTNGVGYKNVPQNAQSAAYTLVAADAGKHIYHPSTDANARTFTIPANASVAYPIGTVLTFVNMTSQVVTIAITTDTMYLAGTGTTGNRSLAQYGIATAIKLTSTTWLISGTGLT